MAYNTDDRHVLYNAKGIVKTNGFKIQFINEKKLRDADKCEGVDEKTLPPFSPALMSAAVSSMMLDLAGVSQQAREALHKWEQSAMSGSYSGTPEEQAQKERYVSYLIDRAYSNTPWWRAISEEQKQKNYNTNNLGPFANHDISEPTVKGLIMDYAWYRENILTAKDSHCAKMLANYKFQKYPIKLVDVYPDSFIAKLTDKDLKAIGATDEEIKAFDESDVSTDEKLIAAVDALMMPIAKRNGYIFSNSYDKDGKYIQTPLFPFKNEDGTTDYTRPDYVAAMKYYRFVKNNNAKIYRLKEMAVKNSGCTSEQEAISKHYLSSDWKKNLMYLSDEFVSLGFTRNFLEAIGMSEKNIDEVLKYKAAWEGDDFKAKCNASAMLNKYIGGCKAPAIQCVRSSITMSLEFGTHSTPEERFIDEFKRQNNMRKESHWQAPFTDKFILTCRNRKCLERIGLPENIIEKFMNYRLDENNLTDAMRTGFSKLLGGNDGIRQSEAWKNGQVANSVDNYKPTVNKDSSIKEIYKALKAEKGGCYQISQREANADDHFAYIFSDNLLEALFRTDILTGLRENNPDMKWSALTEAWINSLPDNCILCDPDGLDYSKKDMIEALKSDDKSQTTNVGYIAKIFSMLAWSGYKPGESSYWTRLSKGQRATFAQVINKEIYERFRSWGKRSEQNALYIGTERKFNSTGSTAQEAISNSPNQTNYGNQASYNNGGNYTKKSYKSNWGGRDYR